MTDGCAAQLGAGALQPGEWNSVLGTTLALKGVGTTLLHDPTGAVYSHRAPHGDSLAARRASSTGAGVISDLFGDDDLDALTAAASRVRDVPLCYPLAGSGERFPFVAPRARGFLVGGGATASRTEVPLDRGAAEPATLFAAVCHGDRAPRAAVLRPARPRGADVAGPVSFTGGGSRNAWWNQLRCDVLGVPVRIPADAEAALGMAVLAAGVHDGDIPGAAKRLVRLDRTLQPDPARSAALAPAHRAFVDALEHRGWLDPQLAEHARRRCP